MQKSYRFLLSALILGAFLLSACSGAIPQSDDASGGSAGTSSEVVFTGTVQSMGGAQWLISSQSVDVDGSTAVDSSIQVGDIVRVEANVSQEGAVLALKIESSSPDDDSNANDANSNDDNANTNGDDGNTNANTNDVDDNSNANLNEGMDDDSEIFGVVESITVDSITIGGVAYILANFTEFKDIISVGDQVKIHVTVNSDGTLTIREIERSSGGDDDNSNDNNNSNDNGNSNDDSNSNDDNSNDDDSSNGNSNDDDSNDDDDDNSNDDDDDSNDNDD